MLREMDEHHVIGAETPFPFDCKLLQPVHRQTDRQHCTSILQHKLSVKFCFPHATNFIKFW